MPSVNLTHDFLAARLSPLVSRHSSLLVFDSHAIAVMTEWDEFKELDYNSIYPSMQKPAFLYDGRNILDGNELSGVGFDFHAIGKSDT